MTINANDERWLTCLDRAIAAVPAGTVPEPTDLAATAQAWYEQLPTNRARTTAASGLAVIDADDAVYDKVAALIQGIVRRRAEIVPPGKAAVLEYDEVAAVIIAARASGL